MLTAGEVKTVDPLSSNSIIDGLRGNPTTAVSAGDENQRLDQADFFALLTQQLSYQDPTKPVENDQMISQMTNFTMADGITALNTNFESFAASMTSNQALQASSLVGQKVLIPTDMAVKQGEDSVEGRFVLPQSSQNMQLRVEDEAGQLIRTIDLGTKVNGSHEFSWDGLDNNGNPVADGHYKIVVQGTIGNERTTLPVSTYTQVQSVSLGSNGTGLTVNTSAGSVKLSDIEEIGKG